MTERQQSALEKLFAEQIMAAGLPQPVREHEAVPGRKFRSDFSYPDLKIALEVDGGIWLKKSRHATGTGITSDCEKMNWMTSLGWRHLRVTAAQIKSGEAIKWLQMTVHLVNGAPELLDCLASLEGDE